MLDIRRQKGVFLPIISYNSINRLIYGLKNRFITPKIWLISIFLPYLQKKLLKN